MIFSKNISTRVLSVACAAGLVASLGAVPAFAEPASDAAAPARGLAQSYEGTEYQVTVYSGNQGTVNGGESVTLGPVALGDTVDFSDLTVEVPADSKYYAKGIRLAGLDNIRSDKNRDGKNTAGEVTVMAANVNANTGALEGSTVVTEDTDFVVAYGIMANRVSFTVTYTDTEGNELAEPQTFFGDIGDVPATAPVYIEGYVPDASLLTKTLVEDESQNVFPFVYTRLAQGYQTEENPDTGGVDVVAPDGSTAPGVYVPNITFPGLTGTGTGTTTGGDTAAAGTGAGAGVAAGAGAAGGAAEPTPITAEPLVTDAGTEVLADDGTPLSTPQEESLDDDETALSSGIQEAGAEAPVADSNWQLWAIGAVVLAAAIVFILVRAARKRKEDEAAQPTA